MTHTGLPVSGYQPQSTANVDRVNANKQIEERLLRVIDDMRKDTRYDQRFISIAMTHFQEGFMSLNRAVFQPGRISLPEDPVDPPASGPAP
jgi:hypothetical protein